MWHTKFLEQSEVNGLHSCWKYSQHCQKTNRWQTRSIAQHSFGLKFVSSSTAEYFVLNNLVSPQTTFSCKLNWPLLIFARLIYQSKENKMRETGAHMSFKFSLYLCGSYWLVWKKENVFCSCCMLLRRRKLTSARGHYEIRDLIRLIVDEVLLNVFSAISAPVYVTCQ